MRRLITPLSLVALLFSGCSTIATSEEIVIVRTNEPTARIYVNGDEVPTRGSSRLRVKRDEHLQITAVTPDGRAGFACVGLRQSDAGLMDSTFFLPGAIVKNWAPGYWRHEVNEVFVFVPPAVPPAVSSQK